MKIFILLCKIKRKMKYTMKYKVNCMVYIGLGILLKNWSHFGHQISVYSSLIKIMRLVCCHYVRYSQCTVHTENYTISMNLQ
jgi:hypothetical protein